MSKNEKNYYEDQAARSRFAVGMDEEEYDPRYEKYNGFSNRREMIFASIQNYFGNCKTMMSSSIHHLRAPSTIIVIIFLVALYIILGVTGIVGFEFSINENIREMKISLDIIVNALLGFFYGPVTSCISVTLCCLVKMVVSPDNDFFIGYVILAAVAGFLHGWILYRHKTMWFGTRFRGFFTDLLAKTIVTRFMVSIVINVLLKGLILYIAFQYPIYEFILHYKYSEVELVTFSAFVEVFIAGLIVDTLVVFFTLSAVNFLASKAFPVQYAQPELFIDENGALRNLEEENSSLN
ncbi:MAG: hypothetical protein E7406_06690 [Ruminococcaceae bacterium]|nr:hypothetical protein [Oscillospiraceae bacterium]